MHGAHINTTRDVLIAIIIIIIIIGMASMTHLLPASTASPPPPAPRGSVPQSSLQPLQIMIINTACIVTRTSLEGNFSACCQQNDPNPKTLGWEDTGTLKPSQTHAP